MLRELFVQNLALIEDVRVELRPGFCAWTGQTGAGKTLLLEALGLLLGERGSAELLRAGADELRITGRFELTRPELRAEVQRILDTTLADEELILTRRLTRAGRSYAYVNDQPVAVGTLREIGAALVDIHDQRESQSLLQPAYQLQLLDAYGHLEQQRQQYAGLAEQVRDLRRRHAALTAERQQRQRELALVRFEREELDNAALKSGELAGLVQERERLAHAQSLMEFAATGCDRLHDEEGSVVEQLGKLQREAHGYAAHDPALNDISTRLEALGAEVQDVAQTLRAMQERWEADPARLDEVEKRIQSLRRLEKKYGRPVDDLIAYRATLDEQEQKLQGQEDDLAALSDELTETYSRLKAAAAELTRGRQRAAKRLVAEAQKQLAELGMAEARLDAVLVPAALGGDPVTAEVPAWGAETIELTLAANKGEPARPLRKVASGGELSRTMLAIKTVLAAHDHRVTLVFDEIDSNVGGRLGDVLGEKLAALGQTHQVICVTHLPQVASYARHHWTIRKTRRGSRTVTTIELLDEPRRLEELASMLRGESRGETTRQEAAAKRRGVPMPTRTRIVATLGPSTDPPGVPEAMLRAGLDVARINFSHGAADDHLRRIAAFREAARAAGVVAAVLADLPGPKLRALIPAPLTLTVGQEVRFATTPGASADVTPTEPELLAHVRPDQRLLLDDGRLLLRAVRQDGGCLVARVEAGGALQPKKGINLPDTDLPIPALTARDRDALAVAARAGVDWLALSFVGGPDAADECRQAARAAGLDVPVLAKVERPQAVERAADIIAAFDGIMVARGDLGVEIPLERVPAVQKRLIAQARAAGKPVVTATEMLDSMRTNPRPTRAETSDVANAIYDGTDAVMLSGETAVGDYPVEAVACMDRICRAAEADLREDGWDVIVPHGTIDDQVTHLTCALARDLGAAAVVVPTLSGRTARLVARHRPRAAIVAAAPRDEVLRQLALVWGLLQVPLPLHLRPGEQRLEAALRAALEHGAVKEGQLVVVLAGHPVEGGDRFPTIRVVRVGPGGSSLAP